VVNGEEDETIWVYLEEWFGSKTAINFGNFLLEKVSENHHKKKQSIS
jgi:hypothetical protein